VAKDVQPSTQVLFLPHSGHEPELQATIHIDGSKIQSTVLPTILVEVSPARMAIMALTFAKNQGDKAQRYGLGIRGTATEQIPDTGPRHQCHHSLFEKQVKRNSREDLSILRRTDTDMDMG